MIKFIECPRDAMQGIPILIPTEKKIQYIQSLLEVGFDVIDFGSFVSPKAIPQMAASGQNPSDIVRKIAEVIKSRQKGQAIEDAIEEIFAPEAQQVPPAGAPSQVEQTSPAPAAAPVGGPTPEQGGTELPPQEVAPDIQSLLSSLTSGGEANASVRTIRRR